MTELADDFRAMQSASKKKRAGNRERGAASLSAAGIPFESRNLGAHLIIRGEIDYWPGTGKWYVRATRQPGRGIRSLLKLIKAIDGDWKQNIPPE